MTGADELFEHVERMAQLDALRKASYVLFPYSEKDELIPKAVLEKRLEELIDRIEKGERL